MNTFTIYESPNLKYVEDWLKLRKGYMNVSILEDNADHIATCNMNYYPQDDMTFAMIMDLMLKDNKNDAITIWRHPVEGRPWKWMVYMDIVNAEGQHVA